MGYFGERTDSILLCLIKWLKCINAQHETVVGGYQIRAMRVVSDSINLFMLPRRYKYSQGILLVCYISLLKTTNKLLYKSVLCLIQEECFKRFTFSARCLIIYCFHQFPLKIILFVNYKTKPLIYGENFSSFIINLRQNRFISYFKEILKRKCIQNHRRTVGQNNTISSACTISIIMALIRTCTNKSRKMSPETCMV